MKTPVLTCALLATSLVLPSQVMADDPLDPEMQTAEARARDAALIRQLNLDMLAIVTERDRHQSQGWRDYALFKEGKHPDQLAYNARYSHYQSELAAYEAGRARHQDSQRQYQLAMEAWRRDVADRSRGY